MRWLRLVARRLLQAVPTVLGVTFVTFVLLRLAPGDPALLLAGPRADAATIERVRESMGLDRPLLVQYGEYLGRLLRGDFGQTASGSNEVSRILAENSVPTLGLVVGGMALTLLLATAAAVLAVRRPGGVVDSAVRTFGVVGVALPAFWVGLMLLVLVALPTGWFPVGGWAADPAGRARALVLPALAMAIATAPVVVRSLRSSLLQVVSSDYVDAGRAIGLRGWALTRRFVLRNAFVAVVPVLAVLLGNLLAGTVIIENAFGLPGLGQALAQGVRNRDYNVVQGVVLVVGVSIVLLHLLADMVTAMLDPRVRAR